MKLAKGRNSFMLRCSKRRSIIMQGRPRRSVLYMPGSNDRALEKAKSLPADALIFDLEDAVAPDAKLLAREQVCAAVKRAAMAGARSSSASMRWRRPGAPRICSPPATAEPDAILVPKVVHAGRHHQRRQDPARRARAGEDQALGHDGDADGDPERAHHRRHRRLCREPARLPGHGHQRPPQGIPRPRAARPLRRRAVARHDPRRRPRLPARHHRRRL